MSLVDRLDRALGAVYDRRYIPDTIVLPDGQFRDLLTSATPSHCEAFAGGRVKYRGVWVISGDLLEPPRIDAHLDGEPAKVRTFKLVSQGSDT